jgi:hypothetical protein
MDLDDLVTELAPPQNRVGKCRHEREHHKYGGAIMMAYAMHPLDTTSVKEVLVHPDGEHGKRFDFAGWLDRRGFERSSWTGKTTYAGRYVWPDGRTIAINPIPGKGDVVAEVDGAVVWAECKGGIINTRHSGQVSRLYKGIREAHRHAYGKAVVGTPSGRRAVYGVDAEIGEKARAPLR